MKRWPSVHEVLRAVREHGVDPLRMLCGAALSLTGYYAIEWNTIGFAWDVTACIVAIFLARIIHPFSGGFCILWLLMLGPAAQYAMSAPILLGTADNNSVAKLVVEDMLSLKGLGMAVLPAALASLCYFVALKRVRTHLNRPSTI